MFLIIVFIIITNNYYEVFQKVIGVFLNVFVMQILFCKSLFKTSNTVQQKHQNTWFLNYYNIVTFNVI